MAPLGQEWRLLHRDRGFRALLALLAVLGAYAGWSGARGVRFQERAIAAAQQEEAERVAGLRGEVRRLEAAQSPPLPRADPRETAGVGRGTGAHYAVQPPAALAVLAVGQSDLEPYYYRVTARPASSFLADAELANPLHLLEGRFDLAFVVIYLLPMLVFALAYDLLAGERERGTLLMLLAQPISLRRVLFARAALRLAALLAVFGALAAAGAVLGGAPIFTGAGALRLGSWIGVAALYATFWMALALGVNALRLSSAVSALACAGAWLIGVLVAPALVNLAVASSYPQPSRLQLIHEIRGASSAAAAEQGAVLARYYEDHPELAAPAGSGAAAAPALAQSIAAQEHVEDAIAPLLAAFEERKRLRQDLAARYSALSPALLAQRALSELAGTGESRHRDFLDQVRTFHAEWREFFLPRIFRGERLGDADYERFPRFAYREAPLGTALLRAAPAAAGLALAAAALLGAALWGLGRAAAVQPRGRAFGAGALGAERG